MHQGVKGHSNSFSATWASTKRFGRSRLSDVLSRWMAQGNHNPFSRRIKKCPVKSMERCFKVSKAILTHFLPPAHRKKRLGRSCLIDVLSSWIAQGNHNRFNRRLKKRQMKSMKRCLKVSKGHANTFSASWTLEKATWTKSLNWCFK
jgi:hypothetical protein